MIKINYYLIDIHMYLLRLILCVLVCLFLFSLEQPDVDVEMGGTGGRDSELAGRHRSPTLSECREIITHLQATIQQQNHEVSLTVMR